MNVFPGEVFLLSISVLDQNRNEKVGFYTYPSNMFFTEADIVQIDLTTGNEDTRFAVVNKRSNQRTSLVYRNSKEDFSFSVSNHNDTVIKTVFTLNLIDSSTGNTVCNDNQQWQSQIHCIGRAPLGSLIKSLMVLLEYAILHMHAENI